MTGYNEAATFFEKGPKPIFIAVPGQVFSFNDPDRAALFFTASGYILGTSRFGFGPVGTERLLKWHNSLHAVATHKEPSKADRVLLITPKGRVYQHSTLRAAVTRLIKAAPFTVFQVGAPTPFSDSE